jgi:hypothetical protein
MAAVPDWVTYLSIGLSIAVFLMIAWINFGRPWRRSRRMRRPFDTHFKQGARGEGPATTELTVPANSIVQLDFRMTPRIHHVQHELILMFDGDPDQKPLPTSVVNTFIKEGSARSQDPKTNANHYIDYDDCYHIKARVEHTRGNTYAIGFSVQTRGPGRYPLRFMVMTEDGEGRSRNDLVLIVA